MFAIIDFWWGWMSMEGAKVSFHILGSKQSIESKRNENPKHQKKQNFVFSLHSRIIVFSRQDGIWKSAPLYKDRPCFIFYFPSSFSSRLLKYLIWLGGNGSTEWKKVQQRILDRTIVIKIDSTNSHYQLVSSAHFFAFRVFLLIFYSLPRHLLLPIISQCCDFASWIICCWNNNKQMAGCFVSDASRRATAERCKKLEHSENVWM